MNIRKATLDDLDILIKVRLDYIKTDMGDLTPEKEIAISSQLKQYFKKHINEDFIAILAEIDNKVSSTAFLAIAEKPANPTFINGKTGTLLNVLTYPEYRRMGIATKVMSRMIDEAKLLGVSSIELSSTEDGKVLYEKLGFIQPQYTYMKLVLS